MLRNRQVVLDTYIDTLAWDDAVHRIVKWSAARESRYVCLCNVHSVVTSSRDPAFRKAINEADMAAPDGAPIAWALRMQGYAMQGRISGPDLMWRTMAEAERVGHRIFLYGSTEQTLSRLRMAIGKHFPELRIAGSCSPPFRPQTPIEDMTEIHMINHSGAQVVFVGLGCPKQENWMAAHRGKIQAVMIGVGAAFDFHSGNVKRAPLWMQRAGLEWLHRLGGDPRRLFKRYLVTNTLFIFGMIKQLLRGKRPDKQQ